jgi:four helix bundle protein
MSYKKLEVWQLARELSIEIHEMTLHLPKFEMFEEGQQIRRSVKTTRSALVEGYGRRIYKADYIKFIVYALSSNDDTIDHLETLFETKSLADEAQYQALHNKLEILGRKLNNFLQAIQEHHSKPYQRGEVHESDAEPGTLESSI